MERGKIPVAKNFLLWIDAVGGFWVSTGETVTIGQPSEGKDGGPDVPILGDLSHRHARIRRDGESYLIEAIRDVRVDGRLLQPRGAGCQPAIEIGQAGKGQVGNLPHEIGHVFSLPHVAALTDGSRIELGSSVRLKFRRPHVLTGTARLEFASNHQTQPRVNAIILMSDTLILGPRSHSHIVCRNWTEEVILFKHDDELYCRTKGQLQIDGRYCRDRGRLQYDSQVSGDGFSFSLEAL
jgi:hypothetical protein